MLLWFNFLDEGICLGNGSDLDSDGRNKMFEKGLSFERNGKMDKALKCYMVCLNGLTQDSRFALLPQCLRNVSTDIIDNSLAELISICCLF